MAAVRRGTTAVRSGDRSRAPGGMRSCGMDPDGAVQVLSRAILLLLP